MSFSSTRCASGASLTSRASSVSCSDGIVGSARARDVAVISEDWGTRPGQEASSGLAAGVLGLRPHVAFDRGHKCGADRIHQRAPGERLITIAADREASVLRSASPTNPVAAACSVIVCHRMPCLIRSNPPVIGSVAVRCLWPARPKILALGLTAARVPKVTLT